jgi:hypothetical protein
MCAVMIRLSAHSLDDSVTSNTDTQSAVSSRYITHWIEHATAVSSLDGAPGTGTVRRAW